MSDTIELLNAIGRDASLRHAQADELVSILEQAHASEALKAAVSEGDCSLLATELGHKPVCEPQIVHSPGREEEEPDEEEKEQPERPSESAIAVAARH